MFSSSSLIPLRRGIYIFFASLVSCPGCVRGPLITRLGSPVTSQISVHSDGVYTYILRDHSEKSAGTGSGNKKQLTLARRIQFTQQQQQTLLIQLLPCVLFCFGVTFRVIKIQLFCETRIKLTVRLIEVSTLLCFNFLPFSQTLI